MRILHTSDWHIGRTFHGHSTDAHLSQVLVAIADAVAEHHIDVVLVAGDIFDTSTPKADAFTMLNDAVRAIREAGAQVILTSGNHDGPARLGHMAEFAAFGGVHIKADLASLATPVLLDDAAGHIAIYGIPYIHPEFLRAAYADFTGNTHAAALTFAMDLIRTDASSRADALPPADAPAGQAPGSPRYVVAAHCFASTVKETPPETKEDNGATEERDITRGGLDLVPTSVFDGPDYVALGHIHGRTTFTERVRYSGAPLRFSFGEKDKPRGAWIVEIGPDGLQTVEWFDLPTPRPVARLKGGIDDLLAPGAYQDERDAWVDIVLTDDTMPLDAMRRCQAKFPHAVTLTHRPANVTEKTGETYAERVAGKSDTQIVHEFLEFVRNGDGPSEQEESLIADALAAIDAKESAK
jgi:exonuclease SbcD